MSLKDWKSPEVDTHQTMLTQRILQKWANMCSSLLRKARPDAVAHTLGPTQGKSFEPENSGNIARPILKQHKIDEEDY